MIVIFIVLDSSILAQIVFVCNLVALSSEPSISLSQYYTMLQQGLLYHMKCIQTVWWRQGKLAGEGVDPLTLDDAHLVLKWVD